MDIVVVESMSDFLFVYNFFFGKGKINHIPNQWWIHQIALEILHPSDGDYDSKYCHMHFVYFALFPLILNDLRA